MGARRASVVTRVGAMTKAELDYSRSLMGETNAILAGLDSTKIPDAINRGHLGCTAVEKVKTFSGNANSIEWRVLIEEASPDAYEFRTLVAEELARRGYSGVAVVTIAASRAAAAVSQLSNLPI
jgi:hypothetical protein